MTRRSTPFAIGLALVGSGIGVAGQDADLGRDLPAFFLHAALRDPYDPIHRVGFRVVYVPASKRLRICGSP
jgi:hypothetical protein